MAVISPSAVRHSNKTYTGITKEKRPNPSAPSFLDRMMEKRKPIKPVIRFEPVKTIEFL
jgi:hypothetical protein